MYHLFHNKRHTFFRCVPFYFSHITNFISKGNNFTQKCKLIWSSSLYETRKRSPLKWVIFYSIWARVCNFKCSCLILFTAKILRPSFLQPSRPNNRVQCRTYVRANEHGSRWLSYESLMWLATREKLCFWINIAKVIKSEPESSIQQKRAVNYRLVHFLW